MDKEKLLKFLDNCATAAELELKEANKKNLIRYSNELQGRIKAYRQIVQEIGPSS